jgi:hypothetical protein
VTVKFYVYFKGKHLSCDKFGVNKDGSIMCTQKAGKGTVDPTILPEMLKVLLTLSQFGLIYRDFPAPFKKRSLCPSERS